MTEICNVSATVERVFKLLFWAIMDPLWWYSFWVFSLQQNLPFDLLFKWFVREARLWLTVITTTILEHRIPLEYIVVHTLLFMCLALHIQPSRTNSTSGLPSYLWTVSMSFCNAYYAFCRSVLSFFIGIQQNESDFSFRHRPLNRLTNCCKYFSSVRCHFLF